MKLMHMYLILSERIVSVFTVQQHTEIFHTQVYVKERPNSEEHVVMLNSNMERITSTDR